MSLQRFVIRDQRSGMNAALPTRIHVKRTLQNLDVNRGHEPESRAGFPACRFTGLSGPAPARATGKSPEPADKNVCPTKPRFIEIIPRRLGCLNGFKWAKAFAAWDVF